MRLGLVVLVACSRTELYATQSSDAACDDLIVWLDARVGVEVDSGSGVSTWQDQSGAHHDATQRDATARPSFGGMRAGHVVVHFDGVSQHLTFAPGFADFSCGLSAFIIVEPEATTYLHAARFFDFSASYGSLADSILFNRFGAGDELLYQTYVGVEVGAYADAPGTVVNGEWHLFEVVAGGNQATLYRDGAMVDQANVALPTRVTRTSNFIARSNRSDGVDSFLAGSIAELRIYARALSDGERQTVEAAMKQSWGL